MLTLPALRKTGDGTYVARSLDLPLSQVLDLRAKTIAAALDAFAPDVLIADKHPLGIGEELEPAVRGVRVRGARTVLGSREILDDPATVRHEWAEDGTVEAMEELYDAVWVYGDRDVYERSASTPCRRASSDVRSAPATSGRRSPGGWGATRATSLTCAASGWWCARWAAARTAPGWPRS